MEKADYRHGKFIILTSEVETSGYTREDYEEWCEMNEIEPGDDYDFYEYCAEETQVNFESDMGNIESCKEYNVPVVVSGTLGLWWGHQNVEPMRYESVADAIRDCMERSDCHDVIAFYNDGEITMNCYHHDGSNCFTIRALSAKGLAKRSDDYKEHDFKRLPYLYAIGI